MPAQPSIAEGLFQVELPDRAANPTGLLFRVIYAEFFVISCVVISSLF